MSEELTIHKTLKFVFDYKLSPRECKILSYAHNREFVTAYEIAKFMDSPIQNISLVMKNMEGKGVFKRVRDPAKNKFKYYLDIKI